jgi:hypothetical protein
MKHRLDARFATRLTEKRTAHMLSVIKAAVVRQGEGESNASGMSWHSVGEGSQAFVTAHAEGDGIRVRVTVDRSGRGRSSRSYTGSVDFHVARDSRKSSRPDGHGQWIAGGEWRRVGFVNHVRGIFLAGHRITDSSQGSTSAQ